MAEDRQVQEGKMYALLGYLSILCILPLILKKDNKFALYHGKQGLVLFIGEVALGILALMPFIGFALAPIAAFIFFVLSFIGIIQAVLGNYWRCPIVANIAEKIKV